MSNIHLNIKAGVKNNINLTINPDNSQTESSETRKSKRIKSKKEMPDEQDTVIEDFGSSVGTIIKKKADKLYTDNQYHKLSNTKKNTVCNGFNSILDLSDNDNSKDSQKSLFTESEWRALNKQFNKEKTWEPINNQIQIKLKEIEDLAATNIKAAYKKSLFYQYEYALEKEESFFIVYSHILKLLNDKKSILNTSTPEKFSEEDYIVHVWSKIFAAVFEDKDSSLLCKWGESVPEGSSESKKQGNNSSDFTIGDKIDLRVCFRSPGGKTADLISVEFAKDSNDDKFFMDHRKILREAKNNVDRFYKNNTLKNRMKKIIAGNCIQIAGVEGQVCKVKLADNGLYVGTRTGSLRLPSVQTNLRKARVLLERLFTLKKIAINQAQIFEEIENEETAAEKCMELKQCTERSPFDLENDEPSSFPRPTSDSNNSDKYTIWIRGSWFPPSVKKDIKYDGEWPPYLFSPPPRH